MRTRPRHLIRLSWLLVFALGLSATAARGQSPGSPRPDGGRLRPAVDTFAMLLARGPDTLRIGTVVDRLTFVGDRVVRLYTSMDSAVGAFTDTIVSRADDLAPVSNHAYSRVSTGVIDFADGRARGWVRRVSTDSIAVDVPLPPVVYDGSDFDLLVRALELKASTRVSWTGFDIYKGTLSTLEGRVTGTARILGHGCWVFEGSNDGVAVVFWIDQETHALVQLGFSIGSSGEAWVVLRAVP